MFRPHVTHAHICANSRFLALEEGTPHPAIKHNQKLVNNREQPTHPVQSRRRPWQRRRRTDMFSNRLPQGLAATGSHPLRPGMRSRDRPKNEMAPGKKASRRVARQAKAAALAPRPVDKLRPIVRCPTIKYNRKVRAGRGFTLTELKEAGIARPLARTIGIAVDHRRQNLSEESMAINVARLKAYRERLILLPRKSNAPKKGDTKTDLSKVEKAATISSVLPIAPANIAVKEIKKSEMPKPIDGGAYTALRMARSNKRYQGAREKRARDKAEAETAKK
ncbi:60S ribosomal protein L13 [Metarhizium album ARSEF 1941]|uniref:60S ribosomal protein L13 n=1 Tax=Metarhizium album (strain ARSEF 1941) TaxID=1081103 RepID=A0A0B2X769_METAS|nr:60S ribosomal protein L13 [Metarhizium album ARSEF 1941]KHO01613.1 60S ribosomal protein L13 [Metarhizium album ARSEF 1941]